ncbi:signal-transducing adaptor protein 2 [Hemicordylus capensis]|uniref:signal-transducing adaptor protein 2 n=1 Tax=Hemicordylus capensis TaxID=884348 RepID=UPI0023027BF9|nr:signal-transducing adaptor protein 2 [Hemicordylus capensis]
MAAALIRSSKSKSSLPPHYFEGFLEKKMAWEKDYKKYWAGLRGLTLYFYNTTRDNQYVEKVELADFVSLTDDNPLSTMATWSTEGTGMNLKMRHQEVKLRMESLESREMWKGFILTMVEMKVPSSLTLLPGHIYMLSEALEKEKERRSKLDQEDSPKREEKKKFPDCFFEVSRTEAEMLLAREENNGNLLLRPGGDGKSISVTTRQLVNGTGIIKHYKINMVEEEYIIDVEEPYRCSSLEDVVKFFVTYSRTLLTPLCLDKSYALRLEVVQMDSESGESTVLPPRKMPALPPPRNPTGVPGGKKIPPNPKGRPPMPAPLPAVLPAKPPVPPARPCNLYEVEEDEPDRTYLNDEDVAVMTQIRSPGGMTPGNVTGSPHHQKTSDNVSSGQANTIPRSFSTGSAQTNLVSVTAELKQKLQKRLAVLKN